MLDIKRKISLSSLRPVVRSVEPGEARAQKSPPEGRAGGEGREGASEPVEAFRHQASKAQRHEYDGAEQSAEIRTRVPAKLAHIRLDLHEFTGDQF